MKVHLSEIILGRVLTTEHSNYNYVTLQSLTLVTI